jgi:hypothetical protein
MMIRYRNKKFAIFLHKFNNKGIIYNRQSLFLDGPMVDIVKKINIW